MSISSFFDYPEGEEREHSEELVFLAGWGDEEWGKLLEQTQTTRFRAGEMVMRPGDEDRSLYIVAQGSLEVLVGDGRRPRRIATIEAGDVLGEQAFLDGRERSGSVRALTDVEMLRLSPEGFEALAARDPVLGRSFLFDLARLLSLRLRATTSLVARATP